MLTGSPWHNEMNPFDVDSNGQGNRTLNAAFPIGFGILWVEIQSQPRKLNEFQAENSGFDVRLPCIMIVPVIDNLGNHPSGGFRRDFR